MQDRLWITEPRRKTCLAEVTRVQGPWFAVDRALFAPRTSACRHPQVADKGIVWVEGDKRKLASVKEEGGRVWYRLRGTVPPVGVGLQCELDAQTRALAGRAHTAMHLLIAAAQKLGAPPMVGDPEVKGGGNFRLTFARPIPPPELAKMLQQAQAWADADIPVEHAFATRNELDHFATPQDFQPPAPVPGPDPAPLVRIGDVCSYPCDGAHADRTGEVGHVRIAHARMGKGGFVVVGRAVHA